MNHEDTKTQRTHEDNFVLLSAFESLWFKFKLTYYRSSYSLARVAMKFETTCCKTCPVLNN